METPGFPGRLRSVAEAPSWSDRREHSSTAWVAGAKPDDVGAAGAVGKVGKVGEVEPAASAPSKSPSCPLTMTASVTVQVALAQARQEPPRRGRFCPGPQPASHESEHKY